MSPHHDSAGEADEIRRLLEPLSAASTDLPSEWQVF